MVKKIKFLIWIVIAILAVLLVGGVIYNYIIRMQTPAVHPEATFEIENFGTVKLELYPEFAPNTVANFIKLIENGFYNNKFIKGKDEVCLYFGTDAAGEAVNPTAGLLFDNIELGSDADYEYAVKGEFIANGFKQNTLRHEKGIITLQRMNYSQYMSSLTEEGYNSGNAQFDVIMSDEASALNGAYAAFGKVIEGMDVLEKIYNESQVKAPEVTEDGQEDVGSGIEEFEVSPKIISATVDTKGEYFAMPEIQEMFDYNEYMYDLMAQYQ